MIEMNESPTRQNRTAILLIAIFSSFAALFCLLSGLRVRYVIVFQLLFLIFGALALFVWYRSYYLSYIYTVTVEYGAPQLLIVQQNGKRRSVVCRLRLDEIQKITPCTSRFERAERAYKFYSYCVTPFPERPQILYADGEFGATAVKIEASDRFLSMLSQYLPQDGDGNAAV